MSNESQLPAQCRVGPDLPAMMWDVLESTPDGFMLFRTVREAGSVVDFEWVYTNPGAARIVGRGHDELVGRRLAVELPGHVECGLFDHYRQVVETGRSYAEELEYRYDGLDHCILATAVKAREGFALWLSDVTERKRLQQRLAVADHMVSVATMAAGVAHEINNPLSYVLSNLDYVQEELAAVQRHLERCCVPAVPACAGRAATPLIEDLVNALQDARTGAHRVHAIVTGLDSFSRSGAGERSPVDVWHVLDASISLAMHDLRRRARLVKDPRPVPPVLGSASQLGQVFVNLLANAVRAIAPGQPDANEIAISTQLRGDREVVVRVRDTGKGIPPEHLKHIFSPFFTTRPIGDGPGLGLSICHGIVSAMGGEISVRSQQGRGTEFEVVLPAASGNAAEAA